MLLRSIVRTVALAAVLGLAPPASPGPAPAVCAECVKAHMEHLAGDALRGRGCGTADEHAASLYIEAELKKLGVKPAFATGMRQAVALETPRPVGPVTIQAGGARLDMGTDFLLYGEYAPLSGRLVKVVNADAAHDLAGAIVFYDHPGRDRIGVVKLQKAGAGAVLYPADAQITEHWSQYAMSARPRARVLGVKSDPTVGGAVMLLSEKAAQTLRQAPDGAPFALNVKLGEPERRTTYNVVGVLHGTDPDADRKALLLSAHYDHLGVRNGVIYHGADDDASGTAAVMEFARILAKAPRPRRTVFFGLFGCEEEGTLGATFFRVHPPIPLDRFAMNLEFEMIGNDDPKRPGMMMLTGWDRSNLGPALAEHGARIGPDMYPEQNFFQRSDNYALARLGVVAQTISAWPIPPSYHDPSDTLANIDFPFMDQAIGSMVGPIRWLVNSDFRPEWKPGMKP
jgi:hypothetical protein